MKNFRVRTVVPRVTEWTQVRAASLEDALQDYHAANLGCSIPYVAERAEGAARLQTPVHLAALEVISGERKEAQRFISRIASHGIWRKGQVRDWDRPPPTLTEIAARLGWSGPPEHLITENWDGQENDWLRS